MAEMCPSQMTADELKTLKIHWYTVEDYLILFQVAVVIICVIILFGYYRNLTKPTFVCAMWGLFIVAEAADLISTIVDKQNNNIDAVSDPEAYDRVIRKYNEVVNIYVAALSSGHWVFGIKYVEVALNLPLLVFSEKVRDI